MRNVRSPLWLYPVTGFLVVVAFGVGLISMAAFGQGGTAAPNQTARVVEVELGDLFIRPAAISVEPGKTTFRVHNAGATQHNFALGDLGSTPMLDPGESATLTVDVPEGDAVVFVCEVPGHADGGMRGTLTVEGSEGHSGHGATMTAEEMLEADAARTALFPAETEGVGGVDLTPRITANGTKVFELTAGVVRWEVEPGVIKEAFAYNGIVPGPTIRAELGDRVRVVLRNELPQPTLIHFHGMTVPSGMDGVPGISQTAVLPGGSFTYEFTVRNTGTNMYHSHFMADTQVPKGLLGAFIVADPADPRVDGDHHMVLNDGPLGYTLNGKSFPATSPISVRRGEVVRIRYMNEGLQIHPMHLHGLPQRVIALDGHLLEQPFTQDTVMVAPGQRVDVLVRATEPGVWAFHCHILNHAESDHGMFGMVTALIVK